MKTTPESKAESANIKRLLIGIAVLLLLIVVALIVWWRVDFNLAGRNSQASENPAPTDSAPALGPKNAPVTIVEYGDFGCPSCWYWYKLGVLDQLRAKYGDQIRFVWRDYPVITLLSPQAAEAGQCANDQDKFWEFHDIVYQHQGAIESSDLDNYAKVIGLNMSQFDQCVSSHRYRDRVNAEQTEAFTYGYNGAPFFVVNNQTLIHGSQPLSVFSSIIDPILAAQK